jgi:hypothetical protein
MGIHRNETRPFVLRREMFVVIHSNHSPVPINPIPSSETHLAFAQASQCHERNGQVDVLCLHRAGVLIFDVGGRSLQQHVNLFFVQVVAIEVLWKPVTLNTDERICAGIQAKFDSVVPDRLERLKLPPFFGQWLSKDWLA